MGERNTVSLSFYYYFQEEFFFKIRLETYRVYDDYGRLSWVLPPEASARLGEGTAAEI